MRIEVCPTAIIFLEEKRALNMLKRQVFELDVGLNNSVTSEAIYLMWKWSEFGTNLAQ